MPDDAGEIRCGVCGRPYSPGQSIRVISTKRGMVIIHRDCEKALEPLGTAEAVVDVGIGQKEPDSDKVGNTS